MKQTTPLLLFVLLLGLLSSCKNAPVACFTVVTPADSIRLGHTVTFDASCSSDATQYYWDLGNGQTSTLAPTVQTIYDSTMTYTVALVVGNSGKSASVTKKIIVLP